jgi:hypothetical protein
MKSHSLVEVHIHLFLNMTSDGVKSSALYPVGHTVEETLPVHLEYVAGWAAGSNWAFRIFAKLLPIRIDSPVVSACTNRPNTKNVLKRTVEKNCINPYPANVENRVSF